MTRAQRMRREKGLERAEMNMDVLHTKKAKSFVRARRIDDRRVRALQHTQNTMTGLTIHR